MDFSNVGNGTIVVVGAEVLNKLELQCLAVDANNLPTTLNDGTPLKDGSTCWVADTQNVKTLHQGAWV